MVPAPFAICFSALVALAESYSYLSAYRVAPQNVLCYQGCPYQGCYSTSTSSPYECAYPGHAYEPAYNHNLQYAFIPNQGSYSSFTNSAQEYANLSSQHLVREPYSHNHFQHSLDPVQENYPINYSPQEYGYQQIVKESNANNHNFQLVIPVQKYYPRYYPQEYAHPSHQHTVKDSNQHNHHYNHFQHNHHYNNFLHNHHFLHNHQFQHTHKDPSQGTWDNPSQSLRLHGKFSKHPRFSRHNFVRRSSKRNSTDGKIHQFESNLPEKTKRYRSVRRSRPVIVKESSRKVAPALVYEARGGGRVRITPKGRHHNYLNSK